MTTPKDKFEPQEGPLPAVPESEEELPRGVRCGNPTLREHIGRPDSEPPDLSRFEPRPATDWLAVIGVGSAMVAFLMWAIPANYYSGLFSDERQTAVAVFLAFSFIALLLRRRN